MDVSANANAAEKTYTRSFYYWEFIMFLYKLILQIMVVFLSGYNQGLQVNLMLVVAACFFGIQLIT
jgi:hypothetical protein